MTGRGPAYVLPLLIVAITGCFGPTIPSGLPCSGTDCPAGQTCDTSQPVPVCVDMLGPVDAAPRPDGFPGRPDATPTGCTGPADCPVNAPVCDPTTMTCRACVADAECASDVCVEYTGTCTAEADALYVTPGAAGTPQCTRTSPCSTISHALTLATDTRHTIKLADGTYSDAVTFDTDPGVNTPLVVSGADLSWDGAVVKPSSAGIGVRSGANVVFEGFTIQDAPTDGINQVNGSIDLHHVLIASAGQAGIDQGGGVLRLYDSWVDNSSANGLYVRNGSILGVVRTALSSNHSGGIRVTGSMAVIVDSMIVGNGNSSGGNSGCRLEGLGAGSRFAHNTIANNLTLAGDPGGIRCFGITPVIGSSIIAGNTGLSQIDASCVASFSLFSADAPANNGNITGQPLFVNPNGGDFHIQPGSPARSAADPASTEPFDVDDQVRPQGAGRDIGADEIP